MTRRLTPRQFLEEELTYAPVVAYHDACWRWQKVHGGLHEELLKAARSWPFTLRRETDGHVNERTGEPISTLWIYRAGTLSKPLVWPDRRAAVAVEREKKADPGAGAAVGAGPRWKCAYGSIPNSCSTCSGRTSGSSMPAETDRPSHIGSRVGNSPEF